MSCTSTLLAVSDVLVHKALESMGKRLVRRERSRFKVIGNTPFHLAHTFWQVDDSEVSKALKGAWDVVPPIVRNHGNCCLDEEAYINMLNEYVHDLVITGTPHTLEELRYRFYTRIGEDF